MKDVNNVHLVCRNLHKIANLHVISKLLFNEKSLQNLDNLVKSSRIFEKFEFAIGYDDYLLIQEKFQMIEEYISFTGSHIKKLNITFIKVDLEILQKLLPMLPNLEFLDLYSVESTYEQSIKWDLKSTKIERLKMDKCISLGNLFESLEMCIKSPSKTLEIPAEKSEKTCCFLGCFAITRQV